jgi:multiple sugar transport system ATP-binding protein
VYVTHDQTEAMTLGDRVAVMRNGLLQQVGAPTELYERPVNLFVAGFIGSPAMNFLPAELSGDTVKLPIGDVRLPEQVRSRLGQVDGGRRVIAGIRPESFEDASLVSSDVRDRGTTFTAHIDLVESLGAEQYAYFQLEEAGVEAAELQEIAADSGADDVPGASEEQVVARLESATKIRRGQDAELWLDTSKMHFFDPSNGDNLTRA